MRSFTYSILEMVESDSITNNYFSLEYLRYQLSSTVAICLKILDYSECTPRISTNETKPNCQLLAVMPKCMFLLFLIYIIQYFSRLSTISLFILFLNSSNSAQISLYLG